MKVQRDLFLFSFENFNPKFVEFRFSASVIVLVKWLKSTTRGNILSLSGDGFHNLSRDDASILIGFSKVDA